MKVEVKKDPRYRIKVSLIKKLCYQILEELNCSPKTYLGVVVVGKRKAKELNQQYRKMDYIPAVLSFPYKDKIEENDFFLGEIMLCFPLLREKALIENQSIEEALDELLRHGIKNLVNN